MLAIYIFHLHILFPNNDLDNQYIICDNFRDNILSGNTERSVFYINTSEGDRGVKYDTYNYEMLAIYSLNATTGQAFHIQATNLNSDGTITIVYDSSTTNSTFTVIFRALFRKL